MRREDFKIRVARNDDGPSLEALAKASEFVLRGVEIDWSDIAPYWLVVEMHGEIVGAVQICPGKPLGRIELLFVSEKLSWRASIYARHLLLSGAASTLRSQGSQLACAAISLSETDAVRFIKGRGGISIDTCHLMAWRLR